MGTSALYGSPPLNAHDHDIMIGLFGSATPPQRAAVLGPIHASRGESLVVGLGFAIAIVIIITGARLMTRVFRKGQVFGLDDWVIIPGALLVVAYLANIIARVNYSCAGKHINDCTYAELALFYELGGIDQVVFFAAVTLIKVSMTFFNRRLTGISSARWKIVHNTFLGVLIVWFFITLFLNIFQCTPVTAFFNFAIQVNTPTYKCLDSGTISNSLSIINAVTDVCLLCVPVIVISRVRMPRSRKIRILVVFCLGAVCCIASSVRAVFGFRQSKDTTWIFVSEVSWTIVDIFFAAIVASLPALNSLVEMAWLKTRRQSYGVHLSDDAWPSICKGPGSKVLPLDLDTLSERGHPTPEEEGGWRSREGSSVQHDPYTLPGL